MTGQRFRSTSPNFHRAFRHRNPLALRDALARAERGGQRRRLVLRFELALVVEELLSPLDVVGQYRAKLRSRGDRHDALVKNVCRTESLRIPRRHLAE